MSGEHGGLSSWLSPPPQTWSSWRFSWRAWTGSSWFEAAAVKSSPFTPKEEKWTRFFCAPDPAQFGARRHWFRVSGHFWGRTRFGFFLFCFVFLFSFFGAGVCRESGTTCDWHMKDLRMKGNKSGERGHAGPQSALTCCTWQIEHRDTLLFSSKLWKNRKKGSYVLFRSVIFPPLSRWCCPTADIHQAHTRWDEAHSHFSQTLHCFTSSGQV